MVQPTDGFNQDHFDNAKIDGVTTSYLTDPLAENARNTISKICKDRFSEESWHFLQDIYNCHKKEKENELIQSDIDRLMRTYIAEKSTQEINIDSATRQNLIKNVSVAKSPQEAFAHFLPAFGEIVVLFKRNFNISEKRDIQGAYTASVGINDMLKQLEPLTQQKDQSRFRRVFSMDSSIHHKSKKDAEMMQSELLELKANMAANPRDGAKAQARFQEICTTHGKTQQSLYNQLRNKDKAGPMEGLLLAIPGHEAQIQRRRATAIQPEANQDMFRPRR